MIAIDLPVRILIFSLASQGPSTHAPTPGNAERQARYRARQQAPQPSAAISRRSSTDRRSRSRRWHDTVAELLVLQTEYAAWCDALPDSLRDSATADALQEIVDLDLDVLASIQPPRGYGRD